MPLRLATRMNDVAPSATKAMTARARELWSAGRDILVLSQGEPDFDTPANICDAGVAAIRKGHTRYTPTAGVPELREAVAAKLKRDSDLDYGADAVVVGCGAKQVIFNALLATLNPGDEVVIPTPCWVSYPEMVRLVGGTPVLVGGDPAAGFKLSPERLESSITPRTRWLILNSPSNPTGAVYSASELAALGDVLRRHEQVSVLTDDIYEKLVYAPAEFTSFAAAVPEMRDRVLIVNGVSKAQAMTGWRVGYGVGPLGLIRAITTIQGQTSSHTSSISQHAAIEALNGDQTYLPGFISAFHERRDHVCELLNRAPGLDCRTPDGAFYAFVSCRALLGSLRHDGQALRTDVDFATHLLEKFDVAVVPGTNFLADGYFRVSFAASPDTLERACRRIQTACETLVREVA